MKTIVTNLFDIPPTDKTLKRLGRTKQFRAAAASNAATDCFQESALCKKFGGAIPDYARK